MDIGKILNEIHFASMTWLLLIPVAMMAIDIVTGLLYAWSTKSFESAKMRTGLAKKCGEILIILVGMLFVYGTNIPTYILTGISAYIIFMELMSILENLDKLGVPIPAAISKVLNNVDDALQNSEDMEELKKEIAELQAAIAADDGK